MSGGASIGCGRGHIGRGGPSCGRDDDDEEEAKKRRSDAARLRGSWRFTK
jgi:hypothetical protein